VSAGEDDQIAVWDLAVEKDPEEKAEDDVVSFLPVFKRSSVYCKLTFGIFMLSIQGRATSAHVYPSRTTRHQRGPLASTDPRTPHQYSCEWLQCF
jgi:hypothetical protein